MGKHNSMYLKYYNDILKLLSYNWLHASEIYKAFDCTGEYRRPRTIRDTLWRMHEEGMVEVKGNRGRGYSWRLKMQ